MSQSNRHGSVNMGVLLTFNTCPAEGDAVVDEIPGLGGRAAVMRFDLADVAAIAIDPLRETDIDGLVALLCGEDGLSLTG